MTFRPVGARIVACVAGGCLVAIFGAVAIALSPEIRAVFTVLQSGTLALILLAMLAILYGIARCRVVTDEQGIEIVNGYRRHRVAWDEIVDVSLGRGAPWGTVTTKDDRTYMLMGIQASDGRRASEAVWYIREQILEHG